MFAALHAQTIGTTHALLYEAWANVAEKRKDYVEAPAGKGCVLEHVTSVFSGVALFLQIFDMGIGCGADPLPRLKVRSRSPGEIRTPATFVLFDIHCPPRIYLFLFGFKGLMQFS